MLLEQFMNPTASQMHSRDEWIAACTFHPLDTQQVLDTVLKRVNDNFLTYPEHAPQVVLDMDSTLYEVSHRTFTIAQDWLDHEGKKVSESTRTALETCTPEDFGYSLRDTFESLELDLNDERIQEDLKDLRAFWFQHFFTDRYLSVDRPYEGTVAFVQALHAAGAKLVYLTGRVDAWMGKGTIANLRRDGFPINDSRAELVMKRDHEKEDRLHKQESFQTLAKRGTIIASFENEPQNIVAMHAVEPSAMHVFVDTVYSDHPAQPIHGLYRVSHFRR
jgi:hypothetical protein